ncbi:integrin alpha-PS1-like isoform X1 [Homarus americanus]|uniref:integrin alpha-PS1-like isoform X1 n=1 Tax=Homarus americanus TaxID=6706 RepID=UPI001C439FCA|nr:integrin alpha-PS1-like isoform X1 [Homarus americanus]
MAVPVRLLLLSHFLCFLNLVLAFNLEPRIPIVKTGEPTTHFGYTVAQHQSILDGDYRRTSWILVGAPKGDNLQPGTNRSGALWKCPLTTRTDDCLQVHTDGFKNPETGLYNFDYENDVLSEPTEDEIKDDQWLGVTLKSQGPGGKVLVCAHRYMHKGKGFQWGFGLCYILTQFLDVADYLEPCRGKPVNEGHLQYGFCQAGTSGLLLDDEAVIGVPGPYTWRGTVHTSNISDNFLLKDKTQYFGPVIENESPVDKYSYLGYSVAAGHFFGNYMSYVGGAPRSNETGQVVFFSRERIGVSQLRVDLTLNGEMFASSFGFEVLAVDINGDRHDDLIVSAPFYHTSQASGAVYVYMNNDGGFTQNHPYTKIEGLAQDKFMQILPPGTEGVAGETRFGFSLTSLGDLNKDGYIDVAVGAPYEGRGAIYIYLGTSNGLLTDPAQIIHAEDMPGKPYNAFGYSLSGGMDLDQNGYPDLLTSSFCSDRVLLIRARPIIDIQTEVNSKNLENIDPTKKGCTEDIGSTETCFSFGACFKMTNNANTRTGLRLKYTIEERVYKNQPIARVRFGNSFERRPNMVQRDIDLRPEDMGRFQCSREIVYLLDGPRDILRSIRFKLSYEIIQREPRPVPEGAPLPDIDDYPILNQREAVKEFEATFAKDCGDDDICVSDLNVGGRLDLEHHETQDSYLLRLGEQDSVPLHVEVNNTGEPAYQSTLRITHHKALILNLKESQVGKYVCSSTSATVVQCGIGNPLTDSTGPLILNFRESGQPFDKRFIVFTVMANSSSTEKTPQDPLHFKVEVIKKSEISIIGSVTPEQAFYGGEVVGESAIVKVEQIGQEVIHKYVIDNRGPWRVNELQVEILWPYQVENNKEKGKWLLYMTDVPVVDGNGECNIDPSFINPLGSQQPYIGVDVKGEEETPIHLGPDNEQPSEGGPTEDVVTDGNVMITKKKTKKVTSITTISKKTSKTSDTKVFETTDRTSTSDGHSSSFSSSSSSSSSGFSTSDRDASIDQEGSGFSESGVREHGRTHSRVSRRVISSSDRSKYGEDDSRINNVDTYGDGDVVSHHEDTRTSSRTSPDGKTKYHETHHESRKVTVKEEVSNEDIPHGRWSDGGGYRQTNTETDSSGFRTSDDIPDDGHRQLENRRSGHGQRFDENRRTSQSGESAHYDANVGVTGDELEESGSSNVYNRGEHGWSHHSGTHRVESVNRGETVRRTHSRGQDGGSDGNYRSIYSEEKRITDGGDTRTEGTRTHDGEGRRTVHDYGGSRGTTDDRSGLSYESGRGEQNWNVDDGADRVDNVNRGHHRVESVDAGTPTRRTGGSSTTTYTYESRGGFDNDDYDKIRRTGISRDDRRKNSGIERDYTDDYDGHHGSGRTYDRTDSDGSGSFTRGHYGGYDRTTVEGRRTHHESNRNLENDDRKVPFDWNEGRTGTEGRREYATGRERTEVRRTWGSDSSRTDQDENVQQGHTDGHARTSGDGAYRRTYGQDSRADGYGRSSSFSSRHGSDVGSGTDSSNLRTTTWELSSGSGGQNRARWNDHSSHHQGSSDNWDNSQTHTGKRISHFESPGPDKNGTYTRVEVDPETGTTTVYTRKVYTGTLPENWDHRILREEVSSTSPHNDDEHIRNKRELRRIKREKELIIKPQAVTDAQTGKTMQVVNLKCDGDIPTAKCYIFRCNIRNLGAKQSRSIRIKSRLWNSTLVEDYPRVSYVSIKSKGSLILPEDIRKDQDESDDTASAETLAYPDLLDQLPPEEVPLWVILVSIFAGLLVLIIIVLILWKLGFFERKRPDPTLSGNLDKDANGY